MDIGTIKVSFESDIYGFPTILDSHGFSLNQLCQIQEDIQDNEDNENMRLKYEGKIIILSPNYEASWEEPGAIPSEPTKFEGYWYYEHIQEWSD